MQAGDRLVISGRAGSGKTYGIANSVAERKALFLAPTHPARSVLEQELKTNRHTVATIHSAIGWYRHRNDALEWVEGYLPAREAKNRLRRAQEKGANPFSGVKNVIVDECSMVGSFLFRAIEEYAEEFELPVVYSGDRFQLPPVKDREVIVDQGFKTITLDRSMRFSQDSEIFGLGEKIREFIEQRPHDDLPKIYGGESVQVVSGARWMSELTQGYANSNNLLATTSDNATLRRLRRKVRQVDHNQLCEGDLVLSKQTDDLFQNGEKFRIDRTEPETRVLADVPGCVSRRRDLKLDGFSITFLETERVGFVLEKEGDADKLSARVRSLYEKGKLDRQEAVRILDWVDQINRFELAALATVHKSQGRSVDTVYIDTGTVLKRPSWLTPENHKRLLYTAITRARERVVFYEMTSFCTRAEPNLSIAA